MNDGGNIDVTCPRCANTIVINRNTLYCPRCSEDISKNVVELYSKLDEIDNKTKPAKNAGKALKSVGEEAQHWGCTIFMLPITFICLLFILAMCSAY